MTAAATVTTSATEVVAAYLTERIGLSVAGHRRAHLFKQIADAMARAGATNGDQYCARLEQDNDSFDELVARVTVGESYFFREPGQLELIRSTILPERRSARGPGTALRLWSAGCSTGQEAYTLAIMLEEEGLATNGCIAATDISRESLRVATTGVYGSWSLRAVTGRQREEYFHPVAKEYRVDERFARSITFQPLNLLDPTSDAPRDIDVILCRNVLIYFTPEAVARAAQHLAGALAPGGWLVTGSSDPPLEGLADLEPTATAAGLMYRRPATGADGTVKTAAARRRTSPPTVKPVMPVLAPITAPITAPNPVAVRPVRPVRSPTPLPTKNDETRDEAVRAIRALGGAGNLAAAADAAADAIVSFPLNAEMRFLEAVLLLEADRPADAATAARAALYLDPELAMAHLMLAQAEVALGRQKLARRSLRNAAALLNALPSDAHVPMSGGEPAGRLAAMAAAHDRALAGETRRSEGDNA